MEPRVWKSCKYQTDCFLHLTLRVNLTWRTTGGKKNKLTSPHSNNQTCTMDGDPAELNVVRERKDLYPHEEKIRLFETQRIFQFAAEVEWCRDTRLLPEYYVLRVHWFMNILIIVQRDATQSSLFIILQVHSTCFGCQPHPSSGVHKTVTTASGTGHITSLQRGQANLATLEGGRCTKNKTSTEGCSYSFVYSWWWVWLTPETCKVNLQNNK